MASLFWGWWELGRSVSLNPLEVGLAFDSPVFSIVNSNNCCSQIVRTIGPREVKYGGQVLKKFKSASMSDGAAVNESALVSESTLVSGSASVNESASINEGAATGENEPVAFSKQPPRLRMELQEDHDGDEINWVMTPRPGDVFG